MTLSMRNETDSGRNLLTTLARLRLEFLRSGIDPDPKLIDDSDLNSQQRLAIKRARVELLRFVSEDPRLQDLQSLDHAELESVQSLLVRLCVEGRLQTFLSAADVSYPIYNLLAGFWENDQPWDRLFLEKSAMTPIEWSLLGEQVRFPFGVPASALTVNSRWIKHLASRSFNILTYKTVRSMEFEPHRFPHWIFVEGTDPWTSFSHDTIVRGDSSTWPARLSQFTMANSFGVPSPEPFIWQRDVEAALGFLSEGQLLIVSVMGSPEKYTGTSLIDDFVRTALLAEATGVRAIELNLSCPNVIRESESSGVIPPLCENPEDTATVVGAVRAALKTESKLIAKLSYVEQETLEAIVSRIGDQVEGVSAINAVQAHVESPETDRTPFVGTANDPDVPRNLAGVSGTSIREIGIDFVTRLAALRKAHRQKFALIGMGGVMTTTDVARYFAAGADAVQSGTGACVNPQMAVDIAMAYDQLTTVSAPEPPRAAVILQKFGDALSSGGLSLVFGESEDAARRDALRAVASGGRRR